MPFAAAGAAKAGHSVSQTVIGYVTGENDRKKAAKYVTAFGENENYEVNSVGVRREEAVATFIVEFLSLFESYIYKLSKRRGKDPNYTAIGKDITTRIMEFVDRNPFQNNKRTIDDMMKAVLKGKSQTGFIKKIGR
jgi:hypothetical protein